MYEFEFCAHGVNDEGVNESLGESALGVVDQVFDGSHTKILFFTALENNEGNGERMFVIEEFVNVLGLKGGGVEEPDAGSPIVLLC